MEDKGKYKADAMQQIAGGPVDFTIDEVTYKIHPGKLSEMPEIGEKYGRIIAYRPEGAEIETPLYSFIGKEAKEGQAAIYFLLSKALNKKNDDLGDINMFHILPIIDFYLFRKRPKTGQEK